MSREERARAAVALRRQGFKLKDIASTLGISLSYAQDLCADPEGTKVAARKARYRGTCKQCGEPTDGSNGRSNAPDECRRCAANRQHEERYWTRDRVLEGLIQFGKDHGRRPAATELHSRKDSPYPYLQAVQREFGSLRAGLLAAGFDSRPPGKYERTPETLAKLSESQGRRWGYGNQSGKAREYAAEFNGEPVTRAEVVEECKRRGIPANAWTKAAKAEGLVLCWIRADAAGAAKRRRRWFSRAA